MRFFGQLRKAILERLGADVGAGTKGRVWFNTTTNLPKCDDGTTIEQVMLEKHLPLARRNDKVELDDAATGNEVTGILPATKGGTGQTYIPQVVSASDPVVGDDSADGYGIGTKWWNSTGNKLYICEDASVGAAVWTEATSSGSSVQVITDVTTAYTALLTDEIIRGTSGVADYDVTLPTAVGNTGKEFTIIKGYTGFILTVATISGQTIGGSHQNYRMGERDSYVRVISNGATWNILSSDNKLKVRYVTSAGQSIPSGVQTIVDYGTLFHDSHPGWTVTGASWAFTAPMEGKYSVRIASLANSQAFSQGNVWLPIINKNGTNVAYAMPYEFTFTGSQRSTSNGFIELNLNQGDTIWTEILQNQGGSRTNDTDSIGNFIEIRAEF